MKDYRSWTSVSTIGHWPPTTCPVRAGSSPRGFRQARGADARARVARIQERLNATPSSSSNAASLKAPRLLSNFRRVDYLQAIERAREYIAAGDIFQVNLSHRLEGEWDGAAWPLYERVRTASPVADGAYLDMDRPSAYQGHPASSGHFGRGPHVRGSVAAQREGSGREFDDRRSATQ